jgi:hypothetical protein
MDKSYENLEKTYELIEKCIPERNIDCLEVVRQVEMYRQSWKPKKTSVILLAESHVYTERQELDVKCSAQVVNGFIPNYPLHYVRFVYCLGYGENQLLNAPIKNNGGTPQYWKIFSSCVAENEHDLAFRRVLKTGTTSLVLRLRNKVDVLRKMKERGIWLLDASIVGLYGSGKKNQTITERIIEICWQNHIANMILESSPKHAIVIGEGVGNILNSKLQKLEIPFTVIPQPQARGTSEWQLENYKKYQRICAKYT